MLLVLEWQIEVSGPHTPCCGLSQPCLTLAAVATSAAGSVACVASSRTTSSKSRSARTGSPEQQLIQHSSRSHHSSSSSHNSSSSSRMRITADARMIHLDAAPPAIIQSRQKHANNSQQSEPFCSSYSVWAQTGCNNTANRLMPGYGGGAHCACDAPASLP